MLSEMFISDLHLTEKAMNEFFSGTHFIMEEAYAEPFEMQETKININIPAGKYPISRAKNGYRIEFYLATR